MSRLRVLNILVFFACWGVLIGGRLVWLQVFRHTEWVERAAKQQQRTLRSRPAAASSTIAIFTSWP